MTALLRFVTIIWILVVVSPVSARDWSAYRAGASRDGYTPDDLPADLSLHWTWKSPHLPHSAWPRSQRMIFDRAFHTVVAGGRVFFGSSADHQVYSLDAKTGEVLWTFFTGGPVRFAPTVWKEKVYAVSDDGYLYCLDSESGKLLWKRRGGPDARKVLGNERMISAWPARGAPVILDDVLYFAAGIWPTDGVYLYALDPADGEVLWANDKTGSIYMPQPHKGADANSGTSAQGYLMAAGDQLFVPTGRAVPAVFDRKSGALKYFHLQENTKNGGAEIMALGDLFYNNGLPFETATGKSRLPPKKKIPGALTRLGDGSLVRSHSEKRTTRMPDGSREENSVQMLSAYQWGETETTDRRGEVAWQAALVEVWSIPEVRESQVLITAGNTVVAGGGTKRIIGLDAESKETLWRIAVDGVVYGLAAAEGLLFVSTDQGTVYCFGAKTSSNPSVITAEMEPYPADPFIAQAADEIIRKSGVTSGYCLDVGSGDGALAYELARRTDLYICGIESDPAKVAPARRKLAAAGVYGNRGVIHEGKIGDARYPKYFADLVVSSRALKEGIDGIDGEEVARLQRPYGGVACLGKPGALNPTRRGGLEGAGDWTHQYSDAANSGASRDTLIKGPLSMLWFRDVDLEMPSRHGRGPAPLFYEGRLIVEGMDELRAVSAYNGQVLWSYPLPGILRGIDGDHLMGTSGTGSNFCVSEGSVYLRKGARCLRIDAATGEKLGEFTAPRIGLGPDEATGNAGKPSRSGTWAHIACEDGILYGSVADTRHVVSFRYGKGDMSEQFTESGAVFAMDAETGKVKWRFKAKDSIRNNTIAIGGGRVYFIDRPTSEKDRMDKRQGAASKLPHETGTLYCLDADTGEAIWQTDENVWGTVLALSAEHDALVMAYQPGRFKLPTEVGDEIAVYRASTGKKLWSKKDLEIDTRPMIIGSKLYAQGGAWDLLSGTEERFDFERKYGCGTLVGSPNLLLFRSGTLGYFDLDGGSETSSYGGIRPGCWINAIPAGGLVLMPDASARCSCSYLNRSWIALQGAE
ncbi:MAG: PQQ-binding-like beta-propeller repeat protein [Verrucomicrobiales bacterium]